jgi:hypothetical protein
MEYQVPQFIEIEDKIFGPFTLKQFIYLAGGAGLSAILIFSLPLMIGIILSIPVIGFALALAFYRMNGKPFIEILEAGVSYYLGGKRLYLWRKDKEMQDPAAVTEVPASVAPVITKEGLSRRKLEALALSLDIKRDGPLT